MLVQIEIKFGHPVKLLKLSSNELMRKVVSENFNIVFAYKLGSPLLIVSLLIFLEIPFIKCNTFLLPYLEALV